MERTDPSYLAAAGATRLRALVVDDDLVGRMALRKLLADCGYEVELAHDGAQGVASFNARRPDIVFMDMLMPVMDGIEATMHIKRLCGDVFVPVIFVTGMTDEDDLVRCIDAGADDFLVKPFSKSMLTAKIRAMERIRGLHQRSGALHARMQEEQLLARSILEGAIMQPNVCPAALAFHLAPATTFNGDLLLSAYTPGGDLHVLLGDFTGHGLAATIGALPAAETFRAMTAKGFGPVQILTEINHKLRIVLPTGRFLAAVFLRVDRALNCISLINCGMPAAWLFKGTEVVASVQSAAFALAVMAEDDYAAAEVLLPLTGGERVVLISDGAIEAGNAAGASLGADALCTAIGRGMASGDGLAAAVATIEAFRDGTPLADDASLVEVSLVEGLFPPRPARPDGAAGVAAIPPVAGKSPAVPVEAGWRVLLELRGHALRELSPVPLLMSLLKEFPGPAARSPLLFTAIAELYNNALDHGVLKLDSRLKAADFGAFLHAREQRLEQPGEGRVALQIDCGYDGESGRLELHVEDSGCGFDPALVVPAGEGALHGRGIGLVRSVCESLEYEGAGNRARAIYVWQPDSEDKQ